MNYFGQKKTFLLFKKVLREAETVYTESLSERYMGKMFLLKEKPRFPSLSPLDIQLENLRIENGDIVGDFEYEGYSTYLLSNLSKDIIDTLPSKLLYSNGDLYIYPSYPYLVGDISEEPFRQYDGSKQYFSFGQTVLSKEDIKRGNS